MHRAVCSKYNRRQVSLRIKEAKLKYLKDLMLLQKKLLTRWAINTPKMGIIIWLLINLSILCEMKGKNSQKIGSLLFKAKKTKGSVTLTSDIFLSFRLVWQLS